jgi:hypothetical protein
VSRRRSNSRKRTASRQQEKPRAPRYSSLTEREKSACDRTTSLVTDLRRGEGPYTKLRRKYHLGSPTARKYGNRDLIGGANGKPVRASKSDRRVRDLMFPKVRVTYPSAPGVQGTRRNFQNFSTTAITSFAAS